MATVAALIRILATLSEVGLATGVRPRTEGSIRCYTSAVAFVKFMVSSFINVLASSIRQHIDILVPSPATLSLHCTIILISRVYLWNRQHFRPGRLRLVMQYHNLL